MSGRVQRSPAAEFSVATYNVRAIMDRWPERKPLLKKCIEEMNADVLCFQECLTGMASLYLCLSRKLGRAKLGSTRGVTLLLVQGNSPRTGRS